MSDDGSRLSKCEWALKLAALGFRIFPLRVGAKEPPADQPWSQIATTDPETIKQWFAQNPEINYGVNPDERHVVIDVDTKKGKDGDARLSELEANVGIDEAISVNTFAVKSPSGGWHYYLTAPFAVSNSGHHWPPGIDIRGVGGYVVGPGCRLIEGLCAPKDTPGDYVVENSADVMTAPAWVANLLRRKGEKDARIEEAVVEEPDNPNAIASATTYLQNRPPAIEGQGGDLHTLVTAMALMDFGISEAKALELMVTPLIKINGELRSWNDTCEPPWDLEELAKKVENGAAYRRTRVGSKGSNPAQLDEAMERALAASGIGSDAPPPKSKWESLYFPANAVFQRELRRESVIPDVLPAHGIAAIIAKRGGGKTAVLIDMALRIAFAADMAWHGHPIDEGFHVVYNCGEDDLGAIEMIRGWCLANDRPDLPKRFHFFAGIMDLLNADDCEGFTKFILDKLGGGKAVTFFDTWQRATTSAGQSDDEAMQRAWHHAEAITRSLHGPGVIACHPPKDDRMTIMGSSVLENSSEALWTLEERAKARRFTVTRIKGAASGLWVDFAFKVVGLGEHDRFGKERTAVVVERLGGAEGDKKPDATITAERRAYATVVNALDLDRQKVGGEWASEKPLDIDDVAKRIARLPEVAKQYAGKNRQPTERALWAQGLVNTLKEQAGVVSFEKGPIAERLVELFKSELYGVPINDEFVVVLRAQPKGPPRFFTEVNKMSKVEEAVDSGGN